MRCFAGYNFNKSSDRYNLFLRGQDGEYDYLYERTYLSRNGVYPNTFSQQTSLTQGAFKINGKQKSDKWLVASNVLFEMPKLPIGIFLDLTSFHNEYKETLNGIPTGDVIKEIKFLYNAGIYFNIEINEKPLLGIYMPLFYSKEIHDSYVFGQNQERFSDIGILQKITFVLNLNEINPFTIKKNIKP